MGTLGGNPERKRGASKAERLGRGGAEGEVAEGEKKSDSERGGGKKKIGNQRKRGARGIVFWREVGNKVKAGVILSFH